MNLPPDFIKPQYENAHCFAQLPPTIQFLLTGVGVTALAPDLLGGIARRYDTVICFLIDAFGWRFFEKYREQTGLLQQFDRHGVVSKLTSQFPSTTAAHVTSIHTGLPVAQSGVYEWQYYEPLLDAVIVPLLFSYAGDPQRDTLRASGIDPHKLYPTTTIYQGLDQRGVSSYVFQLRDYARSTYSDIMFRGARVMPYRSLPEALVNLGSVLEQQAAPSYYFMYYDRIDTCCHEYGPDSPQLEAEIKAFLLSMELFFLKKFAGKLNNALVLLTADHGAASTDPRTTIFLNDNPRFPNLERMLKTNRRGELLVPGGSCRDVFLYVREDAVDDARALLVEKLQGRAEVYPVSELIQSGFFGAAPSARLLERLGNLVILPHANEAVWWYEKGRFGQPFYGHHGGLTRAEMEIPLLLYDLSA